MSAVNRTPTARRHQEGVQVSPRELRPGDEVRVGPGLVMTARVVAPTRFLGGTFLRFEGLSWPLWVANDTQVTVMREVPRAQVG